VTFFLDKLGKPAPERQTILDFSGASDQWLNHIMQYRLHLASDR